MSIIIGLVVFGLVVFGLALRAKRIKKEIEGMNEISENLKKLAKVNSEIIEKVKGKKNEI